MNNEQLLMNGECDIIGSIENKSEQMPLNDITERKICAKCKQTLPLEMFNKRSKTAFIFDCYCKLCRPSVNREWRMKNLDKVRLKERLYNRNNRNRNSLYQKEYYKKWISTLNARFCCWKKGARDRNIQFDLTLEQIKTMPLLCHYTGQTLVLESNKPNTISLDRIDCSKGYTATNVVYCCAFVNIMKHKSSYQDFISACKMIADHCKS